MENRLPIPVVNADSRVYWEAAREKRLVIRCCKECGELHFMPRYLCPSCWSDQMEWVDSQGTGSVHSFSVIRRAPSSTFAEEVPYVIALIELDESPRMIANIIGEGCLDVRIGDRVHVVFEERSDGTFIPQFSRDKT